MHRLKDQTGQALVEFALVLPIILSILLGVIEFGQAFNYKNDMTNMANQALRYAEVNSCHACAGSKVEDYIPTTGDAASIRQHATVCFSSADGSFPKAGQEITVKVSAPFNWLQYLGLGTSTTITSTVTGRLDVGYQNPASGNAYTLSASC